MTDRVYPAEMLRVWGKDIREAESMMANAGKIADERYCVTLDPEDFLDLCAGKWHNNQPDDML